MGCMQSDGCNNYSFENLALNCIHAEWNCIWSKVCIGSGLDMGWWRRLNITKTSTTVDGRLKPLCNWSVNAPATGVHKPKVRRCHCHGDASFSPWRRARSRWRTAACVTPCTRPRTTDVVRYRGASHPPVSSSRHAGTSTAATPGRRRTTRHWRRIGRAGPRWVQPGFHRGPRLTSPSDPATGRKYALTGSVRINFWFLFFPVHCFNRCVTRWVGTTPASSLEHHCV